MDARTLGAYGESLAAAYYRKQGFDILAANYRTRMGEVDLIVASRKLLVFVEVKTRSRGALAPGRCSVTKTKQKRIIAAAKAYLAAHPEWDCAMRFDVYEVTRQENTVQEVCIENAFMV